MNRLSRITFAALLCGLAIAVTAEAATGRTARLFILSGQSNARGRGNLDDLEPAQRAPIRNALIYYGERDWLPLPPAGGAGAKARPRDSGFGIEISFARELAQRHPDDVIAICKAAISVGTPIVAWEKDHARPGFTEELKALNKINKLKSKSGDLRHLYNELTGSTKRAIDLLKRRGDIGDVRVEGLLWVQNESDVKTLDAARSYKPRLQALVHNLRTDLNQPDLAALVMDFHISGPAEHVRAIKQGLREAEHETPRLRVVPCEDLPTIEGVHFNSQGLWLLGVRFADAYRALGSEEAQPK
ncbi:MAG TPA: sialate O-acetylesterase [Kiritimatiellia bacterium]|nr:sialate O-acetylesterase [Kiritimatiellia bacterium]